MLACGSLVEGLRSLTRCWADARGAERRGSVVPTRKSEIAQKRQFWNALSFTDPPPARAMDLSVSIYAIYAIYAIYEFLFPDIPLCDETPLALLGDDETLTKPWEVSDELPCSFRVPTDRFPPFQCLTLQCARMTLNLRLGGRVGLPRARGLYTYIHVRRSRTG